ncbi:MAG: aspartic peptidase domain-containing protein [Linnemannia gamsii]|nr:MAG: aspartic peptidase domain-containing protein [Linnemannia gamsii]
MKPTTIGCTLFTILSATAAANLHRVSILRLVREEPTSIQESIQSTVQRLASRDPSILSSTGILINNNDRQGYISSRIDQRQNAIRSPQIDGERIVLQHNPDGVAYVGQVGIGSPPQYFHLEFDLASADAWVIQQGANCTNPKPCPSKRRFFYPARSTTFKESPDLPWSTVAAVGEAKKSKAMGKLRTDVVQVAGFVVDQQVVGIADNVVGFGEKDVDGVFGLGLHQLSAHGHTTPVENLIATSEMSPEIGIWLGPTNRGGEISFGEADPLRYTGVLTYIDLSLDAVYWSVPVSSMLIDRKPPSPPPPAPAATSAPGGATPTSPKPTSIPIHKPPPPPPPKPTISAVRDPKKSKRPPQQQTSIIFDTSSDLILLPPNIAFKTHQFIHNFLFGWYSGYSYIAGAYTVSCSLDTDLWVYLGPKIQDGGVAGIAGGPVPGPGEEEAKGLPKRWFKIAAKDIVKGRVPVFGAFNVCYSGIQASKSEDDDWVFGTNWFLGNYMTFDHLRRRVGIATSQRPV